MCRRSWSTWKVEREMLDPVARSIPTDGRIFRSGSIAEQGPRPLKLMSLQPTILNKADAAPRRSSTPDPKQLRAFGDTLP